MPASSASHHKHTHTYTTTQTDRIFIRREPGEPVKPEHSNNSSHMLGNALLLNLGRHSDHHMNASKRFYALNHLDEAPRQPTSFPGSVVLAVVPYAWDLIVNKHAHVHALRMAHELVGAAEAKRASVTGAVARLLPGNFEH